MMQPCIPPPLGLAQLAAVLEEKRVTVKIIDCTALRMDWRSLQEVIRQEEPNMVGATALTPYFYRALRVAEIAKEVNPEIITVLGGPHVTYLPEETLRDYPFVDAIACGEGESTICELVDCLEKKEGLSGVRGIAYRSGREAILTEPRELEDLNTLPLPAYHLLPMDRYYFVVLGKFATVLASRGCPHHCTFCSEWRFWGGTWRKRDPALIGEELELLVRKYKVESVWFGDDCFNVDPVLIQDICHQIKSRNLEFSWFYQGRADLLVRHRELLPLMREVGNRMVQIGIEAASEEELVELRKGLTLPQVKEAVELLHRNDIVSQGLIIVGTREDSADSIIHKVRYMQSLDVDFPIFTMLTPFPGSDVYKEAKANGWLETEDYSLYDMAHTVMPTRFLTRKQLAALFRWCYCAYYTSPKKIFRGLFARNTWKRKIWRHMLRYTAKQGVRSFFKF